MAKKKQGIKPAQKKQAVAQTAADAVPASGDVNEVQITAQSLQWYIALNPWHTLQKPAPYAKSTPFSGTPLSGTCVMQILNQISRVPHSGTD